MSLPNENELNVDGASSRTRCKNHKFVIFTKNNYKMYKNVK